MCTELEQLAVMHFTMSWIGLFSSGHHQELDWKQEKQMMLVVDIPLINGFIICLDMWHDHSGNFVLTPLNVLLSCCPNCCDLWFKGPFWVGAHFSCVNEANNWLLTDIELWSTTFGLIFYPNLVIFIHRHLFRDLFLFWLSVLHLTPASRPVGLHHGYSRPTAVCAKFGPTITVADGEILCESVNELTCIKIGQQQCSGILLAVYMFKPKLLTFTSIHQCSWRLATVYE